MKKIILPAVLAFLFTSCDNDKVHELSDKAKKNLEAQHGVINCFDTKDFSKLGDYISEDFIDHAGEMGEIKGLANAKAEYEKMVATINNDKSTTILELANDDYVMSWMHFTGTLTADAMGMKAGDKYDMKSIELAKFKDGKAVEHWVFMDPAEMMKMMGGMPAPPPPATATESK